MSRAPKWLEGLCWAVALCCGVYLFCVHKGVEAAGNAANAAGNAPLHLTDTAAGEVLGKMAIPQLQLTVPIIEGDDTGDLRRGVGHIAGTAMPGGLGTVGLAGHRDTFLRPLAGIRRAMRIDLEQGGQSWEYLVDSTSIVHPEDVRVLDTAETPELVLVTCYPFHYIGAAPLRFIVRAHLVSLEPQAVVR